MSSDNNQSPERDLNRPPATRKRNLAMESAAAMEVPFTFAAAVALGGFVGYYLDKWLHTGPWLLVAFGAFGFVAGILEIARRFRPHVSSSDDRGKPS